MTHSQSLIRSIFQWAYDPGFRNSAFQKVRAAKDVDEMLIRLKSDCERMLNDSWRMEETKEVCKYILSKIESEGIRKYAEEVFEKCKKEQGTQIAVSELPPPSEKQMQMIRSLGSKARPVSMKAASNLIGQLLAKKKAA
jgi:hypothetical protein